MDDEKDVTYRLVAIGQQGTVGDTAATPELAKLATGRVAYCDRATTRLGLERTEWDDHFGKPRVVRTTLIEAESRPGEWLIGT